MKLSIVIVSWNVKNLLKECLNSIFQYAPTFSYEVFVVDNASSDGSAEMVRANFPTVTLIANEDNRGFAVACNQAIRQAIGEYILLLNPDCRVTENSLTTSVHFFDSHPKAGIAGSRIINPDGSIQSSVRRFPTPLSQLLILFKVHHVLPQLPIFKKYFATDFDYSRTQEIDQPMGAAFMIRKECLDGIDLLDEQFFIWFEEVDLCKRARDAGWDIWYDSESMVVHHGGQSFKQRNIVQKQINSFTSCAYYLWKHFGWKSAVVVACMNTYVIFFKVYQFLVSSCNSFSWKTIGSIVVFELLSVTGYFFEPLNIFGFLFLVILTFLLSLKRLEYGILIVISELAVGSKGHLFSLPFGEHEIGVRIGIFCAVFLAWLICRRFTFFKSSFAPWYGFVGVAVVIGVISGVLSGIPLSAIYADANAWIFFLLVFIVWDAIHTREQLKRCVEVFLASSVVRITTILILFYVMGHKGFGFDVIYSVYRWARTTGLAEITQFDFGVSRIFLQSQIYDVILFAVLAAYVMYVLSSHKIIQDKWQRFFSNKIGVVLLIIGVITSLTVSLSRSFWLAAVIVVPIIVIIGIRYYSWKIVTRTAMIYAICTIASLMLLIVVSRIPLPSTEGGFGFDLLAKRVSDLDSEAAAASRWNLLPVLIDTIRKEPIWGYGFGKSITYYSKDPRVLELNQSGAFTTYAFEWGYLDILIKLGFVGFALYLFFLGTILKRGWQKIVSARDDVARALSIGLWCGFVALLITHIFSPYLNHPLGIGYIVAYTFFIENSLQT